MTTKILQSEEQRLAEEHRVRSARTDERTRLPHPDVLATDPETLRGLLAALVESSDDAIIGKDLNGSIVSWNAAAEHIFGYNHDEVIGLPITILLPADRHDEEDHILATLRRGERVAHFETQRVRKDGRLIDVSLSVSPIKNAAGTIVGAAKIARDITARREAETVQATLAAIVESSDDAIVGKTLDGIIMTWNSGAERIFGYTKDEVIGRPVQILLPPERLHEETTILPTLRRGGRIEHFETERIRKDGRRFPVSLSVSPIRDATGKVVGAAKIARDMTTRRALERERDALLAREQTARLEAEAATRAKDVFLATISHELRTPLSPIITWARMLREGVLDEAKTAKALATIERNARTQGQLIDDLLDVSRIVSGKLRLDLRPIDLAAVVQAAIEVVRPAAETKAIRLHVVVDPQSGTIAADPDRLQQVIWNLLSNAIKFTPNEGRVQVVLTRSTSQVEIAVSDTGMGFDPAFRPYMFDRFQQADSSPSRTHGGLGLGLAIVRHIVELHGGTVHAESAGQGRGATFTVTLPLVTFQRAAGEVERRHPTTVDAAGVSGSPVLKDVRILVVDDEPDSNDVVSTLLGAHGAEIRVAASAAQALEILAKWIPHIVVTDIGLPGEDGYALLAQIRARAGSLARLPVIALTAYATRDDRLRILAAGFQMHVAKPIDPAELTAGVANVAQTLRRD